MTKMFSSSRTLSDRLKLLFEVVFRRDRWNIGIVNAPIDSFLNPSFRPRIRWLPQPKNGVYVSDPFSVEAHGKRYLFYEYFDYRKYRGRLFAASLETSAFISSVIEILPAATHRSYPYMFKNDGQVYCVPEMSAACKVVLYKADELPAKWTEVAVLLDGVAAVDSTIFHYDGRWWLLHTDADRNGRTDLYAWYADDLIGPWRRHKRSPVKSDIASARPAGTPFVREGALYRPAQDCSTTYGGRVVINRMVKLSPDEFEEASVVFIEPDRNGPYPDGLHTLSAAGDFTLIDGKRAGFIWWALAATFRKHLRGLLGSR